jgi:undecaprenyl-diphosphatase
MTVFQAIILGIIQGLTEFLPISSSAHLVLTPYLLGWELPQDEAFVFDVLVQVGTLVAVAAYFWNDFWKIGKSMLIDLKDRQPLRQLESRLGWLIFAASLPAGVIGLLLKDVVEAAFNSPQVTAFFLLITALFLVIAERAGRRNRSLDTLSWLDAVWVGFFQAAAIFPGISRSGATITGGMLRNLERTAAARFSFLISFPIMLAAGLFTLLDLGEIANLEAYLLPLSAGFIASTVVGYLSIRWLLSFLTRYPLYLFSIYCAVLGVVTLLVTLVR